MSRGAFNKSTSRQHASSSSAVVSPVAIAGRFEGTSGAGISSRPKSSRTTDISSLSTKQRYGASSLASITLQVTGKSSEVSRYRDWSKMNVVPPRFACFRPCATTARLGSYVAEMGAVGAIRRTSISPATSVTSFSFDPTKEAIRPANFARNSRTSSGGGQPFCFVFLYFWFPCFFAEHSPTTADSPIPFSPNKRIRQ